MWDYETFEREEAERMVRTETGKDIGKKQALWVIGGVTLFGALVVAGAWLAYWLNGSPALN